MSSRIAKLDAAGVTLDEPTGRLVDWAEHPPPVPKPYSPNPSTRAYHQFSKKEDDELLEWAEAASAAGVPPRKIYEEYSTLVGCESFYLRCFLMTRLQKPKHSPAAYESRIRVLKQEGVKHSLDPSASFDQPYPNLDREVAEYVPPPGFPSLVGNLPQNLTYTDFRMDIDKSVLTLLGLEDEQSLQSLLREPWLVAAFREYEKDSPAQLYADDLPYDPLNGLEARSQHSWKVTCAFKAIQAKSGRYIGDQVDKTAWIVDDHEIRFVVRVALDAGYTSATWNEPTTRDNPWMALCARAFWLLNWIRFIHQPTCGAGDTSRRLRARKHNWLSQLYQSLSGTNVCTSQTAWHLAGEVSAEPAPLDVSADLIPDGGAMVAGTNTSEHVVLSTETSTTHPAPRVSAQSQAIPRYTMPVSRGRQQQRGVTWLTQEVRDVFRTNLYKRLEGWGLQGDQIGTCVLVPQEWRNTDPRAVLESFPTAYLQTSEGDEQRLVCNTRI